MTGGLGLAQAGGSVAPMDAREHGIAPLDELLGIEYPSDGPDPATASLAVRDELLQPFGIVHGGVLAAIAESVCSRATWLALRDQDLLAFGQSNAISFLRPISAGTIHASARPRHQGRTTWVWDVEISDDEQRLCAVARLTIAVRPERS
ncbi:MAG: 1,4-dihydroxy-2-naphthoyl-CoA hydrolase [Solirubrobacterales bacterium]|nr:1,4-dihydroxy-2-naphthoyl-CoA hydrolase [Solirubrobacterales bacterium]